MSEIKCINYNNVSKEVVVEAMKKGTPYKCITPSMVRAIGGDGKNVVYSAQVGNTTVMCHTSIDGNMRVIYIPWIFKN